MGKILEDLKAMADSKYAEFSAKLIPNIDASLILGSRIPQLRSYAKTINGSSEANEFLNVLPHKYQDEYLLHVILISLMKDYDKAIYHINKVLPYVDNWAVSDIMSPKMFNKHKDKLIEEIKIWMSSTETYTIRFGIEMLMSFYLDESFKTEYLKMVSKIRSEEYYVNMMMAWYFATALAKQYDSTIYVLEKKKLSKWCHNKTIQKAIESYRITPEQKAYLKTLKY